MSHIHLPDGVLPIWLWVAGFIGAVLVGVILIKLHKKEDLSRRLPLLGRMEAAMVLGAAVEIVPIAYHVNLTVISGILLGPSLIFLATFVVNIILALFGHGGITVVGLNTLTLSIEGVGAYFLFRFFWRVSKRLFVSVFFATFLALFLSTFAMIGVVSLGAPHYEQLIHREENAGIFDFKFLKGEEDHFEASVNEGKGNLRRF